MSIIAVPEDKVVAYRKGVALQDVKLVDSAISEALSAQARDFTVLSQNIPPGSAVPRGTVVAVTVAVTRDLKVSVIANTHEAYAKQTIGEIADKIARSDSVITVLRKNATSETLDLQDREVLVNFANQQGIDARFTAADAPKLFDTYMGAFVMGGG